MEKHDSKCNSLVQFFLILLKQITRKSYQEESANKEQANQIGNSNTKDRTCHLALKLSKVHFTPNNSFTSKVFNPKNSPCSTSPISINSLKQVHDFHNTEPYSVSCRLQSSNQKAQHTNILQKYPTIVQECL